MSLQSRLACLEQELAPRAKHGPPCDVCGAPESAIVYPGVHMQIVPDPEEALICEGCGRALDEETGRPIEAGIVVRLIRAQPPEDWH